MSRVLALLVGSLVIVPSVARADYDPTDPDQSFGASIGIASGNSVTPGGFAFVGHYLYQVTADDWIEVTTNITIGGGDAGCFYDRRNELDCHHGVLDGNGVAVVGAIRHNFVGQGKFIPFTRAGVGLSLARYGDDKLTGIGLGLYGGAGLKVEVAERLSVVAQVDGILGGAIFGRGMGLEPQLGMAVIAGAELEFE